MTAAHAFGSGSWDRVTGWQTTGSYIRAMIRDFVTEANVGLHPWEKHPERPTRLIVNVDMFSSLTASLSDESPASIIDYDPICDELRGWPERSHTELLETLMFDLVEVCFRNPRVQACRVSILKPDIFNEAAGAGVEVFKLRD